jgi:pimeloyl-ACP methyl ester carboxylesterase
MGDAYNAAIMGSKLVVFRNTGHIPMEEVPEQSARVLREFLSPTPAVSQP